MTGRLATVLLLAAVLTACGVLPHTDTWRLVPPERITVDTGAPFVASKLTTTRTGFLATGEHDDGSVSVWTSDNGQSWTEHRPAAFVPERGLRFEVRSLVPLGDGAMAVGNSADAHSLRELITWVSPDGVRWTRDDSLGRQNRAPFLAIGPAVSDGTTVFFDDGFGGLMRRERPGMWSYTEVPEACSVQGKIRFTALGVTYVGLADTGQPGQPANLTGPIVCTVTPAGITPLGDRVPLLSAESAASDDDVTAVVGYLRGPDRSSVGAAVATVTRDGGATWDPTVPLPVPADLDDGAQVDDIVHAGALLVATGAALGPRGVPVPLVWTSDDHGATWEVRTLPALGVDGSIGDVASDGRTILMLAHTGYGPVTPLGLIVNEAPGTG